MTHFVTKRIILPCFYQIHVIQYVFCKGEEKEGGMTYPRVNDGTKLYKPPLERVRESAVVSLLSPTTQTPDAVPSQKLLSLVCTSDLVRPIL